MQDRVRCTKLTPMFSWWKQFDYKFAISQQKVILVWNCVMTGGSRPCAVLQGILGFHCKICPRLLFNTCLTGFFFVFSFQWRVYTQPLRTLTVWTSSACWRASHLSRWDKALVISADADPMTGTTLLLVWLTVSSQCILSPLSLLPWP